jgi:hypothetical protein
MMPPLAWLPASAADASGLALGLGLVMWERRARTLGAAARNVAPSPSAHH